jgi:two-component system, NtrC family, nitrogen regulation sensor histidine kinase GlnL
MRDENLFKNIFSSLIEGIAVVSGEMKILAGNLAFQELFRQSLDALQEKSIDELFPHHPEIAAMARESFESAATFRDKEATIFIKDSLTEVPVLLSISPYFSDEDIPSGALILCRDARFQKEVENSVRQSDSVLNLSVLALGMAHEIRNPLGGIRGSAQLLRDELPDKEQKEYLDVVVKEADRIDRMIRNMMGLAGPQKMDIKKVNIHMILEDIITLEKNSLAEKNGFFIQDYDPSLPLIDADEDKLKQVFLNLIKNAIDASKNGKPITLLTRMYGDFTSRMAPISGLKSGIIIEIIDNGPGISEENQKQIFTPFFSTKKKGAGLGMPISLKIIESHSGKMKIISDGQSGTTVQIILPYRQID